ncbi:MAG: hypothetical protein IPM82_31405 [Saprospiraceae bacterium]|nr:hypothetical protein [Saprospiraceae bacterium]
MMVATEIKKEIHELVDGIDDKVFLSSMLEMLKEVNDQPKNKGVQSINLLQHLDKFIEKNNGLLKR